MDGRAGESVCAPPLLDTCEEGGEAKTQETRGGLWDGDVYMYRYAWRHIYE